MVPTVRLGDMCAVGDGTHSTIARQTSGVLYLSSRNIKGRSLDLKKVYYISEGDFEKHFGASRRAITKPLPNDLLFSIIGSIGEPYLVREGDRFGISSSVAIVRPIPELLSPSYLFYWVKGPVFQSAVRGIRGGVAQGYVSLEMLRSLPVPKISLGVQRRVANVLSAYDDLIENNMRRIAILEEMSRLVFSNFIAEVEAKRIAVSWQPFGDLVTSSLGGDWGQDARSSEYSDEVAVIRGTDFYGCRTGAILDAVPVRYIKPRSLQSRELQPNDLIVEGSINGKTRAAGTTLMVSAGFLKRLGRPAIAASFCKVFRFRDAKIAVLSDAMMRWMRERGELAPFQVVAANGIANFQTQDFLARARLPVPKDDKSRNDLCAALLALQSSYLSDHTECLQRTRDFLLPRLLSGDIEVSGLPLPDRAAAE